MLAGGNSAEREVSLRSGAAVAHALSERGHHVVIVDPADVEFTTFSWSTFDAVFVALHGTFGEDGAVQKILEEAGVALTGSDARTSRLAFSKSASKERFLQCSVPTPDYVLIHESDDKARISKQAERLRFPLAVKPDAQGSSLGVSIVESTEMLPQALTASFGYDEFAILESAVMGSEWTVGFLDDLALPLIRIETDRPFFDFQAKYEDESTRYCFEFDLPTNVVKSIENTARRAREALGTQGLSRVDLRLDRFDRPWVLEVNTIPGLTDHSLIPQAATRYGIEFGELCERAVSSCLETIAGRPRK